MILLKTPGPFYPKPITCFFYNCLGFIFYRNKNLIFQMKIPIIFLHEQCCQYYFSEISIHQNYILSSSFQPILIYNTFSKKESKNNEILTMYRPLKSKIVTTDYRYFSSTYSKICHNARVKISSLKIENKRVFETKTANFNKLKNVKVPSIFCSKLAKNS